MNNKEIERFEHKIHKDSNMSFEIRNGLRNCEYINSIFLKIYLFIFKSQSYRDKGVGKRGDKERERERVSVYLWVHLPDCNG